MEIYPVQNEPIPLKTYSITATGQQGGNGGEIVQETGDLPGEDPLSQNSSVWSVLQKINDSLNEVAQKQQTGDKILNGVEDSVDGMKAQLGQILKNYPPFPPGSQERIRLLRGCVGLRKLIDQLTFPPPEESKMGVENSKVSSPADSVPSANQPGEMTPGNL